MKCENICDALDFLDDDLIEKAEMVRGQKKPSKKRWLKWGGAAACLCLAFLSVLAMVQFGNNNGNVGHMVQQWSAAFPAEDYFKYNNVIGQEEDETKNKTSDSAVPYAETRYFSDRRGLLEAESVIPVMENHPQFYCTANYNDDGSLYSLIFSWHNRDDLDSYSDLTITAGYQEIEQINDCIAVEVDEHGNIIEPAVTVTQRDGVQITARGNKNQRKTLTFQNASGWYQVEGSWNDGYADIVMLLDWLWEHPIDFDNFPMEDGDNYTYYGSLEEYSFAFAGYIPDFIGLGYNIEDEGLTLKNGIPCYFEGIYRGDDSIRIWWTINAEPDYYDQREVIGQLEDLTLQHIVDAMEDEQHVTFLWDDYCIKIYVGSTETPDAVWRVISSIQ